MRVPVLVADHDPESLQELSDLLARRGFDVIATQDGGDALARFFEREPALIVAHEELPVLGGAQLCQQIKAQDNGTRVIILKGGAHDPADVEQTVGSTGCDAVLFSPAIGESLESFLDEWALTSEANTEAGTEQSPASSSDAELFDLGDDDFDGLSIGESTSEAPETGFPQPPPAAFPEPAAAPSEPVEPEEPSEPDLTNDPFGMPIPIPLPPIFATEPAEEPIEAQRSEAVPPAEAAAEESEPGFVSSPEPSSEPSPEPATPGEGAAPPTVFGGFPLTAASVPSPSALPSPQPRAKEPAPNTERSARVMELVAETLDPGPTADRESDPDAADVPEMAEDASSADEPTAPPVAHAPDFGAHVPSPLDALNDDSSEATPIGVFALPPADPSGRPSNVFGEITSPLSALEESIAGYAESQSASQPTDEIALDDAIETAGAPFAEASEEEEGLTELELDDIVDRSQAPLGNTLGAASVTAPSAPQREASRAHEDPVHVMTPSGHHRSVSAAKLRESLPEPGVEDLPMSPEGSPGLRAAPHAKLPPGVPSAGDLTTMPLPRLLYELYRATFTGVLTLNNQGDRRRVFIWGGFPVRVETSQASENLTNLLLRKGRITEAQQQQVEQKIRNENLRVGDALRDLSLLTDRELLDAMRFLNEERMVNTFAWREGTYTFEARADFADGTLFGEVHPLSVIWRGIHDHYDLSVLFDYFSNLRTRYIVTTHAFSVHFAALGPFLRHLNIADILSGKTTFEGALRSDDSRAIELSQLLYFLLVTDMVKPQARPGEAPAELVFGAASEPTPEPTAVDYRELAKVSERIAGEYLRLKDVDYFAALGLGHDADPQAIERAFEEASAAFRFDRLPPGLGDDMLRKVREIVDMLGQARATLLDESRRQSYEKQSKVATVMSFFEDDEDTVPDAQSGNGADEGAEGLYRQGQSLLAEGRFKEAQACIQQALGLEPKVVRYWIGLSQAILLDDSTSAEMSRHGALNCLRRAVEADPRDIAANWEIGKLLVKVGQTAEARGHLQRVLESDPGHRDAQAMLAQL